MGHVSPLPPGADPRLTTGAYISRGLCLYRVDGRTPSQVTLENVFTLNISATSAGDVLANYELQRAAAS